MLKEPMSVSIPTRPSLLRRIKNWQDHASWEDFFNTYSGLIYNVARKCGLNDSQAQDVTQETIICVSKSIRNFKYDPAVGSFKAWLLTVTQSRIDDQFRRNKRLGHHVPLPEETGTGISVPARLVSQAPEEIWNTEWERTLFEAADAKVRRRVEPQTYQMFELQVNRHWTPQRIAERFDVTVGQVYLAKNRVTRMIKEEYDRLERGEVVSVARRA